MKDIFSKKFIVVLSLALCLSIAYVCVSRFFVPADISTQGDIESSKPSVSFPEDTSQMIKFEGDYYIPNENLSTWLLLGIDKFADEIDYSFSSTSNLVDFLLLLVFDNKNETYQVIHISRDTMTYMDQYGPTGDYLGEIYKQITLSHTYGKDANEACENVMKATSNLLYEIPIENYISCTMDAVPILNDMVGGVEVTIVDDFSDKDPDFVMGEKITLKGEQALTYVRPRDNVGDGTNESRMRRQEEYMEKFEQSLSEFLKSDEGFMFDMIDEILPYLNTNASSSELLELTSFYSEYPNNGILHIEGENKIVENFDGVKYMEFHPDENELKKMVLDVFYEKL